MKIPKGIAGITGFLILLGAALGLSAWRAQAWWSDASSPVTSQVASSPRKQVLIQIPPGTSAQQIGQKLEAAGLIRSARAWELWARWLMWQKRGGFQAGNYELSSGESMTTIADKIWSGQVAQQSFTIPEGWSLKQMGAYFEQQGYFKAQDFLDAAAQVPKADYPWLPDGIPHLEGFLYPDTYQTVAGTSVTPKQIVRQMLDRFEQVALPIYNQQRNRDAFSLLQWVTLASIVEKEAVIPTERARISGVFHNRLKKNMPLASDPTVEYAFGIKQTKEKPLTFAQVAMPSPYNTYVTPGLPPTPIAAPGVASLKATLDPEATDYLYFVARYDGSHVFSRTLSGHEAAQNKIRDRIDAEQAKPTQKAKN